MRKKRTWPRAFFRDWHSARVHHTMQLYNCDMDRNGDEGRGLTSISSSAPDSLGPWSVYYLILQFVSLDLKCTDYYMSFIRLMNSMEINRFFPPDRLRKSTSNFCWISNHVENLRLDRMGKNVIAT